MKKTFNRLLAATVAIPVALGQILAISANAAEDPAALQVTTEQLLKVNAETGFPESPAGDTITYTVASDWNKTLGEKLTSAAADKTIPQKSPRIKRILILPRSLKSSAIDTIVDDSLVQRSFRISRNAVCRGFCAFRKFRFVAVP